MSYRQFWGINNPTYKSGEKANWYSWHSINQHITLWVKVLVYVCSTGAWTGAAFNQPIFLEIYKWTLVVGGFMLLGSYAWILIATMGSLFGDHITDYKSASALSGAGWTISKLHTKDYWDILIEFFLMNITAGFAPDLYSIWWPMGNKESKKATDPAVADASASETSI